jgi:hypothetical protein
MIPSESTFSSLKSNFPELFNSPAPNLQKQRLGEDQGEAG